LEKLLRSNEVHEIYPKRAFEQLLGQYWFASACRNLGAGRPAVTRFINSPLARCVDLGIGFDWSDTPRSASFAAGPHALSRSAERGRRGRLASAQFNP
jgi:hypothetical protein